MMYQLVIKRKGAIGAWHSRPNLYVYSLAEARAQYEAARANMTDFIEAVVLEGETSAEVEDGYERYITGRTFRGIDPTDDGIRKCIEFAPLRSDYTPKSSKPYPFEYFHKDTLRGLIAVMRRVMAGEVGGPNDGE